MATHKHGLCCRAVGGWPVAFVYCVETALLWSANRKLRPGFRMVPFLIILNDP